MMTTPPNHALQRTRHGVAVCNRSVPRAVAELGSLGHTNMTRKLILTFLPCCFLAAILFAAETREPKTNLKVALAEAEKYVAKKKIDVSTLFVASIYRSEFLKNSKQNCWTIIWSPKDPHILDGEVRVYIYDDGRIEHGGSA